jgi:hypothetical protein
MPVCRSVGAVHSATYPSLSRQRQGVVFQRFSQPLEGIGCIPRGESHEEQVKQPWSSVQRSITGNACCVVDQEGARLETASFRNGRLRQNKVAGFKSSDQHVI